MQRHTSRHVKLKCPANSCECGNRPANMHINSYTKLALATLITLIGCHVRAQWTLLPESHENTRQYISNNAISREGQLARMIWLNDMREPQSKRFQKKRVYYLSQIFDAEYECEKKQYRIAAVALYSGNMATGTRIDDSNLSQWRDLTDGWEMWRTTWKVACSKK